MNLKINSDEQNHKPISRVHAPEQLGQLLYNERAFRSVFLFCIADSRFLLERTCAGERNQGGSRYLVR